jgi:hypothetical protein
LKKCIFNVISDIRNTQREKMARREIKASAVPGTNPSIRFEKPTARNSDTMSSIFSYTLVKTHTIDTHIIQMKNKKRQSLCYSPETSIFIPPEITPLSSHHLPYITYALSTSLGN